MTNVLPKAFAIIMYTTPNNPEKAWEYINCKDEDHTERVIQQCKHFNLEYRVYTFSMIKG